MTARPPHRVNGRGRDRPERVDMNERTCSIIGCDATVRATGWCKRHYNTWYRTGDPLSPPRRIPNDNCKAEGCNTAPRSKTADYCEMHYYRLRRIGTLDAHGNDPGEQHHGWVGDLVSYRALHSRIRRARGSASQYACADCGKQAHHWSYDHQDDDVKHAKQGAYSTDVNRYEPRCRSCHHVFDLAH